MTADQIIETLGLQPHPEGGWFRQTWAAGGDGRPSSTAIYFLLKAGEVSHWHKVDADEIWHHYAGANLILSISASDTGPATDHVLSPDLTRGSPQILVPKDHWQRAESQGDWTLVGATVSPGFQFEGFELAAPGFDVPRGS